MVKINTRASLMITAFISGFVMLAYELIVARLLAPSLGSSTYVWTSVIGTVIAALAAGYWAGGQLADRRGYARDVAWLCLLAAAAVLWTLLVAPLGLAGITGSIADPRIGGVVAALVLCAPASFLLGALSPYLAKLRITSLASSGSSIASLGSLNSLGGIIGTFVTGFLLFSLLGSRESLLVLIGMLVTTSFLYVPREDAWRRVAAAALVSGLGLATVFVHSARAVAIDTPTAHYSVFTTTYDGSRARLISTGPRGAQSGVDLDHPDRLLFWYTRALADVVAQTPARGRILVLGGGTFTLPSYLARTYPASTVDAVEIDGGLLAVAARYFNYKPQSNLRVITGDARTYVNRTDARYDIVIVDVYNDTNVPFQLLTREYAEQLARIAVPDAVVAANVIGTQNEQCAAILGAVDAAYRSQFAFAQVRRDRADPAALSNMIYVYGRKSRVLGGFAALSATNRVPYTDNFAPADVAQTRCVGA